MGQKCFSVKITVEVSDDENEKVEEFKSNVTDEFFLPDIIDHYKRGGNPADHVGELATIGYKST